MSYPAFPVNTANVMTHGACDPMPGMELRDYFAAMALPECLRFLSVLQRKGEWHGDVSEVPEQAANDAYMAADAMMAAGGYASPAPQRDDIERADDLEAALFKIYALCGFPKEQCEDFDLEENVARVEAYLIGQALTVASLDAARGELLELVKEFEEQAIDYGDCDLKALESVTNGMGEISPEQARFRLRCRVAIAASRKEAGV